MTAPFRPAWWLPGPHTMTMWPRFFRPRPPLPTVTETWETPDGDEVDIVRLRAPAGAPRLVITHGLEGSPRSHYAVGVLALAERRGWAADLLVFRTCNGRVNRVRRSYHSGETSDLDFVIRRVLSEEGSGPLGLAGVSLGANVLLKWLGEQGEGADARVRGAVAVSTPFDLARSCRRINRGFSRLYQRHFLRSLRAKALAKIDRFPDIAGREAVETVQTMWEFDDIFTAAAHGFRDAADYYARSSSISWLPAIRVPTLLLSARDDPFHPPEVLEEVARIARDNSRLTTEFTDRGGHVGFMSGPAPWRAQFWAEHRIEGYFAERF